MEGWRIAFLGLAITLGATSGYAEMAFPISDPVQYPLPRSSMRSPVAVPSPSAPPQLGPITIQSMAQELTAVAGQPNWTETPTTLEQTLTAIAPISFTLTFTTTEPTKQPMMIYVRVRDSMENAVFQTTFSPPVPTNRWSGTVSIPYTVQLPSSYSIDCTINPDSCTNGVAVDGPLPLMPAYYIIDAGLYDASTGEGVALNMGSRVQGDIGCRVVSGNSSHIPCYAVGTLKLLPFAEANETALIYVDANKGVDPVKGKTEPSPAPSPGTAEHPFKTIQAAANLASLNNEKNIGSRVIISAGTYRENVRYRVPLKNGSPSNTSAPVTFEAAPGASGQVIISGSDVWTGWTASSKGVFTHNWSAQPSSGPSPIPTAWASPSIQPAAWEEATMPEIARRSEMVFVTPRPGASPIALTQVIKPEQMVAGTFYFDYASTTLSIFPPSGINMAIATVDVTTRQNLFTIGGYGDSSRMQNIAVKGLVFEHGGGFLTSGLEILFTDNVFVEGNQFRWNNAFGMAFGQSSNGFFYGNTSNHNGTAGFEAGTKNIIFWNNEASYNNWRGAQGAFYGCAYAGAKLAETHTSIFQGLKSTYNITHGIWFDTDNRDILMTRIKSLNNFGTGIQLEANNGPITITYSTVCNNSGGIETSNQANMTVSRSTLSNSGGDIIANGTPLGRAFTDWEINQSYLVQNQNWTLSHNIISSPVDQYLFAGGASPRSPAVAPAEQTPAELFKNTFVSDYNQWYSPNSTPFISPTYQQSAMNFDTWMAQTGKEQHSTFESTPGPICASATPDYPDYWLTMGQVPGTEGTIGRSASTVAVNLGQSATYEIQISPVGAFNPGGTVNLTGTAQQKSVQPRLWELRPSAHPVDRLP